MPSCFVGLRPIGFVEPCRRMATMTQMMLPPKLAWPDTRWWMPVSDGCVKKNRRGKSKFQLQSMTSGFKVERLETNYEQYSNNMSWTRSASCISCMHHILHILFLAFLALLHTITNSKLDRSSLWICRCFNWPNHFLNGMHDPLWFKLKGLPAVCMNASILVCCTTFHLHARIYMLAAFAGTHKRLMHAFMRACAHEEVFVHKVTKMIEMRKEDSQ